MVARMLRGILKSKATTAYCLLLSMCVTVGSTAYAQAVPDDLRIDTLTPGQPQSPPGAPVAPGPPPPLGSGDTAPLVTAGDSLASRAKPPTGKVDTTSGSKFRTELEKVRKPPSPSTSTLGGASFTIESQPPSPNGMGHGITIGGRLVVDLDYLQKPKQQNSDPFALPPTSNNLSVKSKLMTIRQFARFLVKLGVVFATVMMIFAAFAVILGRREGGARVVSTAGGLILLLMAYTIWKQVMLNTRYFGDYPPVNPDRIERRPPPTLVNLGPAKTPVVPAAPVRLRSKIEVKPLGELLLHTP